MSTWCHTRFFWEGPRSRCYGRTAALRLIVQPCDEADWFFCFLLVMKQTGGMKLTGENRSTRGKICHSATLSTTNPTWIDLGLNPGLRGERPATNRLSHGTAMSNTLIAFLYLLCSYIIKCISRNATRGYSEKKLQGVRHNYPPHLIFILPFKHACSELHSFSPLQQR
jgi:hypothetical protein